jgi:HJR/Mrr/RecB family endonuclease
MTESKPSITGTTHTLPFDKLSPRDFERLCLWLVEREGYECAEHLGAAGSEQGRDVVAWREARLQTLIASVA